MSKCEYCGGPLPEGRWEKVSITDAETNESQTVNVPVQGHEVRLPVAGDWPLRRIVCSEECMWEWDRRYWLR